MSHQTDLFSTPHFDGETYEPSRDHERLAGLLGRVRALMADRQWRTLAQIQAIAGGTEASCSARLRDLRKQKFGSYEIERRYISAGLWEYRLLGKADANISSGTDARDSTLQLPGLSSSGG